MGSGLSSKKVASVTRIGAILELAQSFKQRLEAAISEVLSAHQYELVLLEYVPTGRILRLYVDHPQGITLDHCSQVSHWISDMLDADASLNAPGGLDARYTLEVSSPGLDRPLVKPADFQRFAGRKVTVVAREMVVCAVPENHPDKRKKFQGQLVEARADGIRVETDGRLYDVQYAIIDKARLVPEF